MDTLKDKSFEHYDYLCRYETVPYYYDTLDNKKIYGIGSNIEKDISYVSHKVVKGDTLDSLSLQYYNSSIYYWVIAMYNDIQDAFIDLSEYFDIIKIPNISSITFGKEN